MDYLEREIVGSLMKLSKACALTDGRAIQLQ